MRWAKTVVLLCSLVCSGLSTESSNEPHLEIKARSSVYNVGENRAIFCAKKNLDEPMEWLSPAGTKVGEHSSKNVRVYVEPKTHEPNLMPLMIHNMKVTDSGNWTCRAGALSDTMEIIVGEKVIMAVKMENIDTDEGKSVKLHCQAKGIPVPTVQWYMNSIPITKDNNDKYLMKTINDDHTLTIKNLDHSDAGDYMCKVTQKALSHYTDKIVKLVVHHKPFRYDPETNLPYTSPKNRVDEIFAVMNDTKNITCSAKASPPAEFRWFKRSNNNFDEEIRDTDLISISDDNTTSTFVLRMRDDDDLGQYKCTAKNTKGFVDITFDVTAGEKPSKPTGINQVEANVTFVTFNITAFNSSLKAKKDFMEMDPNNLPVEGYSLHLILHTENIPDWEQEGYMFNLDILDVKDTLFTVGGLPNSTNFDVRVRSRNAAGFSDWFVMHEVATTGHAVRLAATLIILIAAGLLLLY